MDTPIKIKKLRDNAQIPQYQTAGAAGADLVFAPENRHAVAMLDPTDRFLLETGLSVEIPPGYEIQIRPRSGLANKYGVTVLNTPGTIDSDYRGEIKVLLVNLGDTPAIINPGDRIAQMVVAMVPRAMFVETELEDSVRGTGGFGSTG